MKLGIIYDTHVRTIDEILATTSIADVRHKLQKVAEPQFEYGQLDGAELLEQMEKEMQTAAANLEFERAAILRDEIKRIKKQIKK